MEYDVFFSYPHKDAREVVRILEALRTMGLNVWIDKSEIRDYESITMSIVEGLAQSKVLLAYYSLNYWRSRACQWELTAAFLAAQREGDLAGARKIHEKVLEIRRRVLGDEHSDTSLSAWNLVYTLLEAGDGARAVDILNKHLLWLLDRDPASLEANQQKICEMMIQMIQTMETAGKE